MKKANKIVKRSTVPSKVILFSSFILSHLPSPIFSLEEIYWALYKGQGPNPDLYLKSVNSSTFNRVCSRKSLRNYMLIAIPSRPDYLRLVNKCSVAKTFIRILIKFHSPVILVLLIILREINLPSSSCLQFSGMIIIQWILTNSFYLTSSLSRTHTIIFFVFYYIFNLPLSEKARKISKAFVQQSTFQSDYSRSLKSNND